MKLQVLFKNGTEPVNYECPVASTKDAPFMPIELKIIGGTRKKKRNDAQISYFQNLAYAFSCVNNTSDDYIRQMKLSDIWFLNSIYKGNVTSFGKGNKVDEEVKYDIVIYDITNGTITEQMYLTRNQVVPIAPDIRRYQEYKSRKNLKVSINGVEISNLYNNSINTDVLIHKYGKETSANVLGMIAITEKYLKGYHLKWSNVLNKLILTTDSNSIISYDGIRESDIYSVIKLFTLLLEKGEHIGVFFINVSNIRTPVLQGLLALIQLVLKNKCLVFLYNGRFLQDSIQREVLELPNYFVEGKN